jgi:hypothetical protein
MKLPELAEELNLTPKLSHRAVKPFANKVVVSQKGEAKGTTCRLSEAFCQ